MASAQTKFMAGRRGIEPFFLKRCRSLAFVVSRIGGGTSVVVILKDPLF